jgi:signal transduction histidine kinase
MVIASAKALVIKGNAAALEQLFFNLLSNAAQASPRGGCIGVTFTSEGASVVVTVTDQGPGFTPDAHAQAFNAFFSTKAEGTGLGLTLAARIAAAHGGRVVLGAPSVGGARVHVELPQWLDEPAMDSRIAPHVEL